MSGEVPHAEGRSRERRRFPRRLKYALIATYLAGLALVPQWATLGLQSAPALAGEAELEGEEKGRFQAVSWDLLAGFPYEFEMPGALEDASPDVLAERNARLIPVEVRALDGRPIAIRGHVIPIRVTRGRVTEFILAAKNEIGCCFGDGLLMNQWIHVQVAEAQAFDYEPFAIATVLGVLDVGEEVREGTVLSLYRMSDVAVRSG